MYEMQAWHARVDLVRSACALFHMAGPTEGISRDTIRAMFDLFLVSASVMQVGFEPTEMHPRLQYGMFAKFPIFPGPRTAGRAVLTILLSNADQTSPEPLRGRVTLAAIVRTLKRKYHWPIKAASFPSNAADGRATCATGYSLPPKVIAAAMDAGADDWLKSTLVYRDQS